MPDIFDTIYNVPEEGSGLADRLRTLNRHGSIFAGSSDPLLNARGQDMLKRSVQSVGDLRGAVSARRKEKQGIAERKAAAAVAEKRHKELMDWKKKEYNLKVNSQNQKITDKKEKDALALKPKMSAKMAAEGVKSAELLNEINTLNRKYDKFSDAQRKHADQGTKELIIRGLSPQFMENFLLSKFAYTDPEVRAFMAQAYGVQSEFSKMMAGLALTGFEIGDRMDWAGMAPGLTMAQRNDRIEILQRRVHNRILEINKTFKENLPTPPDMYFPGKGYKSFADVSKGGSEIGQVDDELAMLEAIEAEMAASTPPTEPSIATPGTPMPEPSPEPSLAPPIDMAAPSPMPEPSPEPSLAPPIDMAAPSPMPEPSPEPSLAPPLDMATPNPMPEPSPEPSMLAQTPQTPIGRLRTAARPQTPAVEMFSPTEALKNRKRREMLQQILKDPNTPAHERLAAFRELFPSEKRQW